MINIIRAFEAKQQIFGKNIISKNYEYFPNLKKFTDDLDLHEKHIKQGILYNFIW